MNKDNSKMEEEEGKATDLLTTSDLIAQVHKPVGAAATPSSSNPYSNEDKIIETPSNSKIGGHLEALGPTETRPNPKKTEKKKEKKGAMKRFFNYISKACTNERDEPDEDDE